MGKPKTPEESFRNGTEMLEINWDEEFAKLEKLSAEELEQLNADFDPENALLPIHDRVSYVCNKTPGRMFERDVLLDHLEEFDVAPNSSSDISDTHEEAKQSTIGSDYVPFVKKDKPPSKWEKKKEELEKIHQEEESDEKIDFSKLSKDESEALSKATAQDLVEAAAQMGMNSFLTQDQVHAVKSGSKPDVVAVTKATKLRKMTKQVEDADSYLDVELLLTEIRKNDPEVIAIAVTNMSQLDVSVHERIAECLKENTTLKFLSLANSNINDYSAKFYADVIRKNKTLESLNFESNYITPIGVKPLLDALTSNTSLREMMFENQRAKLGQKCEIEIADALKNSYSILNFGLGFETAGPRGTVSNILLRNNDRLREARKRGETTYKLPEARKAAIDYLNKIGTPPWIKQKRAAEIPNKLMLQAGLKNLKRVPEGQRSPRVGSPERLTPQEEEAARKRRERDRGGEDDEATRERRERRKRGEGEDEDEVDGDSKKSGKYTGPDPLDDIEVLRRKKAQEQKRPSIPLAEPTGMGVMTRRRREKSPMDDGSGDIDSLLKDIVQDSDKPKEGETEEVAVNGEIDDEESPRRRRRERRQGDEDDDEDDANAASRKGPIRDPFEDDDTRKKRELKEKKLPLINLPEPSGMPPVQRRRRGQSPTDDGDDIDSLLKDVEQAKKDEAEDEAGEGESERSRRSRRRRGEGEDEEGEAEENGEAEASRRRGKYRDPFDDEEDAKNKRNKDKNGPSVIQEEGQMGVARRRRKGGDDEEEDMDSMLSGVPQVSKEEQGAMEAARRRRRDRIPTDDSEDSGSVTGTDESSERSRRSRRREESTDSTESERSERRSRRGRGADEEESDESTQRRRRGGRDPFDDDDDKKRTEKKREKGSDLPLSSVLDPAQRRRRDRTADDEEGSTFASGESGDEETSGKRSFEDPLDDINLTKKREQNIPKPKVPTVITRTESMGPAARRRRERTPIDDEPLTIDVPSVEDSPSGKSEEEATDAEGKESSRRGPIRDPFDDDENERRSRRGRETASQEREREIIEGAIMPVASRRRREKTPIDDDDAPIIDVPAADEKPTIEEKDSSKPYTGKDPFDDDENERRSRRGRETASQEREREIIEGAIMPVASRRRRERTPIDDDDGPVIDVPAADEKLKTDEKDSSKPYTGKDPFDDDENERRSRRGRETASQERERGIIEGAIMPTASRRRRERAPIDDEEGIIDIPVADDSSAKNSADESSIDESKTIKGSGNIRDPFDDDENDRKSRRGRETASQERERGIVEGAIMPVASRRRRERTPIDDDEPIIDIPVVKDSGDKKSKEEGPTADEESPKADEETTSKARGSIKDPFDDDENDRRSRRSRETVSQERERGIVEGAIMPVASRRRRGRTPIDDEEPIIDIPVVKDSEDKKSKEEDPKAGEESPKADKESSTADEEKTSKTRGSIKDPFDDDENDRRSRRSRETASQERERGIVEGAIMPVASRRRRERTPIDDEPSVIDIAVVEDSNAKKTPKEEPEEAPKRDDDKAAKGSGNIKDPFEDDENDRKSKRGRETASQERERGIVEAAIMPVASRRQRERVPIDDELPVIDTLVVTDSGDSKSTEEETRRSKERSPTDEGDRSSRRERRTRRDDSSADLETVDDASSIRRRRARRGDDDRESSPSQKDIKEEKVDTAKDDEDDATKRRRQRRLRFADEVDAPLTTTDRRRLETSDVERPRRRERRER